MFHFLSLLSYSPFPLSSFSSLSLSLFLSSLFSLLSLSLSIFLPLHLSLSLSLSLLPRLHLSWEPRWNRLARFGLFAAADNDLPMRCPGCESQGLKLLSVIKVVAVLSPQEAR